MFEEFDNSNKASWGPLAGMPKEELQALIKQGKTKDRLKSYSKQKYYKVTPVRVFTFEQVGETFTVPASSQSLLEYNIGWDIRYQNVRDAIIEDPDFSTLEPKISKRYKIVPA